MGTWRGWKTTRSWPGSCGDYLGLLDERVATITAQLESGNDLTAHISSAQPGVDELDGRAPRSWPRIAGLLRGAVERQQKHVVPALVKAMTTEAVKVHQQLQPGPLTGRRPGLGQRR